MLKIFLNLIKSLKKIYYEVYFLDVDIKYPKNLLKTKHVTFFQRIKVENLEKLITNWYDKNEYVIHIGNLKQELEV